MTIASRWISGGDGEDTDTDEQCDYDDGVIPDDSVSAKGGAGAPYTREDRLKVKTSERELAALRQLVQKDTRFGVALERSCQSMYEAFHAGKAELVLPLLAGLVWRSLCIVWELEVGLDLPKARQRAKILILQAKVHQLGGDFDRARAEYLRELCVLRDQLRKIDSQWLVDVSNVVYVEEPVIYYEPLRYLDEDMRLHVAEIVEEKLKLLLLRLKRPDGHPIGVDIDEQNSSTGAVTPGRDDAAEASRRASETAHALAVSKQAEDQLRDNLRTYEARVWELEAAMARLEVEREALERRYESDVSSMMVAVRKEWQELDDLAKQTNSTISPPPPLPNLSRGDSVTTREEENVTKDVRCDYVKDLLQATAQARNNLLSMFEDASAAAAAAKKVQKEALESAAAAASADRKMAEQLKSAREEADRRTAQLENEIARLRQELNAAREAEHRAAEETVAARAALRDAESKAQEAARGLGITADELEKARIEAQQLREENERLRAMLAEGIGAEGIQAEGFGVESSKQKRISTALRWKGPTGKVFERLFQDSIDRSERRRLLEETIAQARAEKVVELFQGASPPSPPSRIQSLELEGSAAGHSAASSANSKYDADDSFSIPFSIPRGTDAHMNAYGEASAATVALVSDLARFGGDRSNLVACIPDAPDAAAERAKGYASIAAGSSATLAVREALRRSSSSPSLAVDTSKVAANRSRERAPEGVSTFAVFCGAPERHVTNALPPPEVVGGALFDISARHKSGTMTLAAAVSHPSRPQSAVACDSKSDVKFPGEDAIDLWRRHPRLPRSRPISAHGVGLAGRSRSRLMDMEGDTTSVPPQALGSAGFGSPSLGSSLVCPSSAMLPAVASRLQGKIQPVARSEASLARDAQRLLASAPRQSAPPTHADAAGGVLSRVTSAPIGVNRRPRSAAATVRHW